MKIFIVTKKEAIDALVNGSKDSFYVISKANRDYSRYEGENRILVMHSLRSINNMSFKHLLSLKEDETVFIRIED